MIVPDVNLLLYASIRGFAEHARARRWWEEALNGDVEIGLAAPALFGFIRLSTNPRVFDAPMPVEQAVERVKEWLERPHVRLLLPGARHLEIAFRLLSELGSAGNLTTDVQLAALAMEHQAELHSNDSDFSRFPGLRWTNPLR
ncbi:MAG: type II toxin-antitoxin system VapC family toxin [Myxococcaceae bacterium]|nr:type II toxin-antitoxin system VapC family toxin [Myxococcaceae bacterium]MCI0669995.1 type II toxin-antitoxin system VapC family toxin [Myxococcaceae bacterium]